MIQITMRVDTKKIEYAYWILSNLMNYGIGKNIEGADKISFDKSLNQILNEIGDEE